MSGVAKLSEPFRSTELGNLPLSWDLVCLGDLFDVQQGKALSPSARKGVSPRPFLRTANVLWGRLDLSTVDKMDFAEDEAERLSLKPGDLLVCEGGEIGRTALWNGTVEGCLYQNHVHRLRRKRADVFPDFIMYWMQAAFLHLRLYGGVGNKTTIPNLSGARLKQLPIPLPPFPEQRTIAGVLAKIQAAVEVQEKVVATLKEVKAAAMAKLFREGLRGEPLKQTEIGEIPESWDLVRCETVCETITVGIVVTPAKYYAPVGVPCFRSFNVQEDRLLEKDLVFISEPANELHGKSKLRAGDVIIVRTGYPGTACVVPQKYEGANCVDLIIARPNRQVVLSDYLARYMNSPEGRRHVLLAQGGLAQQHFNVGAFKQMTIALPPKNEQADISRIGRLLDDNIVSAERKLSSVRSLFSSMLHLLMTGQVRVTRKMIALQALEDRRKRRPKWSGKVDEKVLEEAVKRIVEAVAPEKIILFGSAARGEMGPDSDLDLLVVKSCENRREVARTIRRQLIGIGVPKDVVVVTPEDVEEYKDIPGYIIGPALKEGEVLYAA